MKQRSSNNWKTKSGSWDSLNISLIDFHDAFPVLSSIPLSIDFVTVTCNDYKQIKEGSLVSMFVDDYILERYWNNPVKYIGYFNKAKFVMSPDFSLLVGMPGPMQAWNVYRNRLVGYVWQKAGINVIPTVSWSDKSSFEYCFEGVSKGSCVAVSNVGCRNDEQKKYFDEGFEKMKEIIKPMYIFFQCNKKHRSTYKDDNIVFIKSFWDNKREQLKDK